MTLSGLAPLGKLVLKGNDNDWTDAVAVFGFFGGAAVLTGMAFRGADEAGSRSSDTREGIEVWTETMRLILVAVSLASLIVVLGQLKAGTISSGEIRAHNIVEPVLLLVIIVCSTGYWTLLARSVIGGLLLAAIAQAVLYALLVGFVTLINRMAPVKPGETNLAHTPEVHAALMWFIAGFGLTYAGIMLWLGRKRFVTSANGVTPGARAVNI